MTLERLDLPENFLTDTDAPERIPGAPDGQLPVTSGPAYTLYRLMRHLRPSSVLEIGTQEGASAVAMGHAFQTNNMPLDLTCIDPFLPTGDNNGLQSLEAWYENVRANDLSGQIQLFVTTSERVMPMLKKKFDFVLIDGSHEYDHVKLDWQLALLALNVGGYVVGHDYVYYESVRRGADEAIADFDLPFAVNGVQRNYRGDLCGWVVARKTREIEGEITLHSLP